MNRMRIAYLHCIRDPEAARGGPGVHIASSTAALRELGHDVEVIGPVIDGTTAPSLAVEQRSRLRRAVAAYVYEPRAILRSLWRARRDLARVRAARPDVLLARYEAFEYAPIMLSRALGVPLVWEVNGTSSEIPRWNPDLVLYPGTRALEALALNSATAIFVVSEELKNQLVDEGAHRDRIAVIPNGADPTRFDPRLRTERPIGDLPEHAAVVGYLGSFSSWHDVDTMLRIIPTLAAAHPDVRFVLAGARVADLGPAQRRLVENLPPTVVFPGVVPIADAARWMARFDVALSIYPPLEGYYFSPVKLFEYMASGCAIVATDIGQQGQLIRDGVTGLLTKPGDQEGARIAIDRLLHDAALRRRLGAAARETLVAGYTWKHNAQRISDLCEDAARRPTTLVPTGAAHLPSRTPS